MALKLEISLFKKEFQQARYKIKDLVTFLFKKSTI